MNKWTSGAYVITSRLYRGLCAYFDFHNNHMKYTEQQWVSSSYN
jgi:hypothetical protein